MNLKTILIVLNRRQPHCFLTENIINPEKLAARATGTRRKNSLWVEQAGTCISCEGLGDF